MEIIYCSKCGSMIPPGGIDEGKRYLKDDEPLCPKCYKLLPDEEHDGSTMVVSDSIVEQLASQEPPDPDFSLKPKPKTSNLSLKPAKRKRASTKGLPAATRQRRPSGPQGRPGSRSVLFLLLGLAGLGAVVAVLFLIMKSGGSKPPPVVEPQPVVTPDPTPIPDPVPDPAKQKEKERLARLAAAYESAAAFWKANSGKYEEALALFKKAGADADGTEWESKVEASEMEVQKARAAAADAAWGAIREKSAMLVGEGDYDAALAELVKSPAGLESELAERVKAEREVLKKQAEEKIGSALAAAEKASAEGQPQQGIAALEKVKNLKYAPLSKKVEELRKRLEKDKLNVGELAVRRKKALAWKRYEEVLSGFEQKAMDGLYADALKFAAEERRGIDAEALKLMPPGALEAAEKLAAELVRQEGERQKQVGALVGKEVELHLAVGGRLKGKVEQFKDSTLHVTVRMRTGGSRGHVVKLSDLAPGALAKLLPATKLEGAEAHLAAAIDALADRDFAGARKLLAAAKDHQLFKRWSARLAKLDAEYREKAAAPTWDASVAPLIRKEYDKLQARSLIAALDAFEKDYGATEFARGKRAEVKGLRGLIGAPTIDDIRKLFKGKVVKFDPKTLRTELLYDFSSRGQLADFKLSGKVKLERGGLVLESTGIAAHRARFGPDLELDWKFQKQGGGYLGTHIRSGTSTAAVCLEKNTTELWFKRSRIGSAGPWGYWGARLAGGVLTLYAAKKPKFKPLAIPKGPAGFSFYVRYCKGTYDDVRVAGCLDREWLVAAVRKGGLGTVVAPTPGPATTGGAWRGTWKKLPGELLKGLQYAGHISAVVDPKRNHYVLLAGDFRVFAYSLADNKWSLLSGVASGDGKTFPARSVNTSAIHDPKRDGIYFSVAASSKYPGSGGFLFFDLQKRKWTSLLISRRQPRNAPLGLVGGEPIRHNGFILERFDIQAGAWRKIHCGKLPSNRKNPGGGNLAYDSRRKRFVLFSGDGKRDDTWIYDPARKAWTQLHPASSPSARKHHSMCYDPVNDVVVLQGGDKKTDTWIFDPGKTSWTELQSAQTPSCHRDLLSYDPKGKRMVAWGNKVEEVWTLKVEPAAASGSLPFLEKDGLVVFEAENYHRQKKGSGPGARTSWTENTELAGYAGRCALRAMPAEEKVKLGTDDSGARLDYDISFSKAGTYYVWVRMAAGRNEADTVACGLDGKVPASGGCRLRSRQQSWNWTRMDGRGTTTVMVPRPGTHALNIWLRESCVRVDRIILTTDWKFKPEAAGPPESPRGSGASVPEGQLGADSSRPFLEKDGLVVFEARNATSRDRREDKPGMEWTTTKNSARCFVSTPKSSEEGQPGKSAMLGYAIRFSRPGNYYVWMLRRCQTNKEDSCFVQLAGKLVTFDNADKGKIWGWFRHPESFKVAAGDQQLIIARREGGYRINRILLTDKADYVPAKSLRESPRAGAKVK